MSAQIITIGRKQWVVGLDWNSYTDKPDRDELEQFADTHSYDWVAIRVNESVIQGGFCEPIDGIKRPRKLPSLAAYLADSNEQPWIGIYQISEGLWWYIAVRDGHAILPNGDVIGDSETIKKIREKHAGFDDWNYVEGTLENLAERIQSIEAKPTYLNSLRYRGPSPLNIVCTALAATIIAGTGGYYWYQEQSLIEKENAIALAKVRAQLAAGQKIQPVKSPLLETPYASTWLNACKNTIYPLPLSMYGWSLETVSCEPSQAIVTWKRSAGATVADRPAGSVSDDGDTIIQTILMEGLKNATDDDSQSIQAAGLLLRAWAQQAGITLTMKNNSTVSLPGAENQVKETAFPQLPFSLNIKTSPFDLDFSSVPGLRLTNVTNVNEIWHLEGVIYGR